MIRNFSFKRFLLKMGKVIGMKKYILQDDLNQRIILNRNKMCDEYYDINHVFQEEDCEWPGDKEGRALLAFVSHYKMDKTEIPCMHKMIEKIPEITGGKMFFGPKSGEVVFEQQLSGHSWYLRGLCEYYEQFSDERVLEYLNKTFNGLYLPTKGRFEKYPVNRTEMANGGVSGHSYGKLNGWMLSSDIGCAFMSIDGLSHYYKITENPNVLTLLYEMAESFDKIDKYEIEAQTHCSLTAARGFMRMYEITDDYAWLKKSEKLFKLYLKCGMTYTYQNFNWFKKGDTWTEPCAIIDSLMLALMLYKATQKSKYRTCAARIYFNGFATLQRPNGGAGTDTTVSQTTSELKVSMYEAPFCCSMRLAEGLWFINENIKILYAETNGKPVKDSLGRYIDVDIIYAEISSEFEKYAESYILTDGHKLFPLINLYKLKDEEECMMISQKIVFKR